MFITLEANEGAGKSTQSRLLVEKLRAEGYDVVHTREPGGSAGAEEIRNLLLTGDADRWSATVELLLFTAARRDHIEKTLRPAIEKGSVIVCDRYVGSTYALQGAGGMDTDKITRLFDEFCGLKPDLTLLLDIDPNISLQRGMQRLAGDQNAESRFEEKGMQFHQRVSELFLKQCAQNDEWVRIDANRGIAAIQDDIYETVIGHPVMKKRRHAA
jgi:dTMP kinase